MRDTFKKLIYAIEQSSMAKQASAVQAEAAVNRPMSYNGVRRTSRDGRTGYGGPSVADQAFGVTATSMLPNLETNMSMHNGKMSEQFLASGSFLDMKSGQGIAAAVGANTTSDILFLKRLLFLKAALDNDQSVSSFAVPFDEDKAF